jgi:pilus assembly protein CpaC
MRFAHIVSGSLSVLRARHKNFSSCLGASVLNLLSRYPKAFCACRCMPACAGLAVRTLALLLVLFLSTLAPSAASDTLTLEAGGGRVVSLSGPAANVFVADPKVAEVRPASPTALFVFGLAPGRTTIAAVDAAGHLLAEDEVLVEPSHYAAAAAQSTLARLLPGSRIQVSQTDKTLLLSGSVASPEQAAQAVNIVRGFVPDAAGVVNQLTVRGQTQVTLAVRMVEMDRNITRSLGINWTALGSLGSIGRLPALSGALNGGTAAACAIFNGVAGNQSVLSIPSNTSLCGGLNLNSVVDALASDGLVHVLAEPNLTVMSGEPASFLVGGEFPIPVGQQNGSITVEFKSYGVQLRFVPTVLDDGRINLKVAPEVSQLSTQGAVTVPAGNASITIPALTVRRAETTVELGSGQGFAIAGLLEDSSNRTNSGLPALRNLPAVGTLFGTTNYQVDRTELVILVTPIITRPVDDPASLKVPGDPMAAPAAPATTLVPLPASMQRAGVPSGAGFIVQ